MSQPQGEEITEGSLRQMKRGSEAQGLLLVVCPDQICAQTKHKAGFALESSDLWCGVTEDVCT